MHSNTLGYLRMSDQYYPKIPNVNLAILRTLHPGALLRERQSFNGPDLGPVVSSLHVTARLGVVAPERQGPCSRKVPVYCQSASLTVKGVNASDFSNKATACARLGCEGFRGVNDGDTTDLGRLPRTL
jgi:hypothetical protein